MPGSSEVTRRLQDLQDGSSGAVDSLMPVVYEELRRIAHRKLIRERAGHTLSTTALVHEAYLKMVDQTSATWRDRAHFCALAAQAMRRILIDYARRRSAAKRPSPYERTTLEPGKLGVDAEIDFMISLDQCLNRLGDLNGRLVRVVEMRYFAGMTEKEVAEVLDLSVRTIRRDWDKARAWLYREMYPEKT